MGISDEMRITITLAFWTTVSLLLKSEPVEINQKFKFLVEDIDVWKFLKASRVSRNT